MTKIRPVSALIWSYLAQLTKLDFYQPFPLQLQTSTLLWFLWRRKFKTKCLKEILKGSSSFSLILQTKINLNTSQLLHFLPPSYLPMNLPMLRTSATLNFTYCFSHSWDENFSTKCFYSKQQIETRSSNLKGLLFTKQEMVNHAELSMLSILGIAQPQSIPR